MEQTIKHSHIWKYIENGKIRVCESPFPMLVNGCGRVEKKDNQAEWVHVTTK